LFTWGVLYGLLSSVFEPVQTEVQQEAWQAAVAGNLHRALSPDELAQMVVRGWITQGTGEAEATKAGIAQNDFATMVANRRNPVSPEEAAVALRRGLIAQSNTDPLHPGFLQAIQRGNLGDEWAPIIESLAKSIPSPADVLQAYLEGQITDEATARNLYKSVGGADIENGVDWFTLMFNTRGSAPTPNEAAVMAHRGIIPWGDGTDASGVIEGEGAISFRQAFLEGPWRNKWEKAWHDSAQYLPPPRTITALLKQGAITAARASELLTQHGLAPDLVAAYVSAASITKTTKAKELSEANVITLLNDKLITVDQAVTFLEQLGYPANEATALATTSQAQVTISELKANVNRVGSYYIGHKVDRANAADMLGRLGLDSASATAKLAAWDIERAGNVAILTAAQIESAWEYEILTETEALQELQIRGYTPLDAWTLLSIKAKQALPNKPGGGPGLTT
jgi:hypothetical protein